MPKFYSERKQNQDKWVLEVLKNKHDGYFVDIGASDGLKISNTAVLEFEFGWKGICVEPHSASFQQLITNRKCICENVCIAAETGEVDFIQRGVRREISGIVAPFSDKQILDRVKSGHSTVKKPAITLLELLHKHNSPKIIDYLSIDTEGAEYEILKNFPFNLYIFRTITVEHNCHVFSENKIKQQNIRLLLEKNQYLFAKSTGKEDWYIYKGINNE